MCARQSSTSAAFMRAAPDTINAPPPKIKIIIHSPHRCPLTKSFSPNTPPRARHTPTPHSPIPLPIPSPPPDRPTDHRGFYARYIYPHHSPCPPLIMDWTWTFVPFPICFVGRARAVKLSSAPPAPRRVSSRARISTLCACPAQILPFRAIGTSYPLAVPIIKLADVPESEPVLPQEYVRRLCAERKFAPTRRLRVPIRKV
ncbi:hypothetical protein B0H13DRAFT_2569448 [Mycena leptocephala]|nr:hypothetical protein B0H13DRAFT_2569448 [Mycena leptocephala]